MNVSKINKNNVNYGNQKIHPKAPHRHDYDWTKTKPRSDWYSMYSIITDMMPAKEEFPIYNYINLSEDIAAGHEIMFTYNDKKYSISISQGGWYFTVVEDYENAIRYETPEELLDQVRIGIKTLEDIFNFENLSELTIY
ncbi:hypothetical protein BBD42_23540 [Paenibacillus sp. BIHB 4019]|uniref:Uncharacterized protein n=1 Tax=Paenibacillus sp. BIHB 4019 TaxID=1870819 RepID=A0A1B2DN46_9BACL|nr:hypothetical protein [Paenibacillus sp. BIHB 4019]ANY69123.1 hypothetical protein BBD42_23540 [Paenibacillus sp. BIHB 4019]